MNLPCHFSPSFTSNSRKEFTAEGMRGVQGGGGGAGRGPFYRMLQIKFFPREAFYRVLQIKYLSKCLS